MAAAGCRGRESKGAVIDSGAARTPAASVAAVAVTGTKPSCPATGQWSECAVFDRLDHAGLAPRRDSTAGKVQVPPLTVTGTRLSLGTSELDVFIYPDAASRERDEAQLDRSKYIEASDEPTLRGEATLIRNVNLLAVLRSRNDHQRERVSDALTAGPPRPTGNRSNPNPAPR
jgi:hypothetical protein